MDQNTYAPTRPKITEKEIPALVNSGAIVMRGEYRGVSVEKIKYNDKTTGKAAEFLKCEMNIENVQGKAVSVEIRLPRGLDNPAGINVGLTKGQQVVLRLASLMEQKGRTVATVGAEPEAVSVLA